MSSYYKFIEGGRILSQKTVVPLLYELEIERGRTHKWMKNSKSKKVEVVGLVEEKVLQMSRELSEFRTRESKIKEKLQEENMRLKEKL